MTVSIAKSVESILGLLHWANSAFLDEHYLGPDDEDGRDDTQQRIAYYLEKAFIELLILLEALDLASMHQTVSSEFERAKAEKFATSKLGPDDPYLVWQSRIRMYADAVLSVHGLKSSEAPEAAELEAILRRAEYAICDKRAFGSVPAKEADVHDRLEAILKCYYPDLKRKPALTKPIKNFEPDSGIPSIQTLIEYKFVTDETDAKRVVDEILADASAYQSKDWRQIVYAIYETARVYSEKEWEQLLSECRLGETCRLVVLRGESKP